MGETGVAEDLQELINYKVLKILKIYRKRNKNHPRLWFLSGRKFIFIDRIIMIIKLTYSSIAIINTLGPVGPRVLIAILPLKRAWLYKYQNFGYVILTFYARSLVSEKNYVLYNRESIYILF